MANLKSLAAMVLIGLFVSFALACENEPDDVGGLPVASEPGTSSGEPLSSPGGRSEETFGETRPTSSPVGSGSTHTRNPEHAPLGTTPFNSGSSQGTEVLVPAPIPMHPITAPNASIIESAATIGESVSPTKAPPIPTLTPPTPSAIRPTPRPTMPTAVNSTQDLGWMQDGLTDTEQRTLTHLQRLESQYPDLANVILGAPWLVDDIADYEVQILANILRIADVDISAAKTLVANLLSRDTLTEVTADALNTLAFVAMDSREDYHLLVNQPWFEDGLTDKETALIAVLLAVLDERELFLDLIQTGSVLDETFVSPLGSEVHLLVASVLPPESGRSLLEDLRLGIETMEELMGVQWPARNVIVLLSPDLDMLGIDLAGIHLGSFMVVSHPGSFLLHHELAHYYFAGEPYWLSEGAAHFLADYTLHVTEGSDLETSYIRSQHRVGRSCIPQRISKVNEWIDATKHLSYLDSEIWQSGFQLCHYNLGHSFLLGMYNSLGHQVVSAALRDLYSQGPELTEEAIYQAFLSNTPSMQERDLQHLYSCLHGRPITGYEPEPLPLDSPDKAALGALYNATNGVNWTNARNWLSDDPLNYWYGVVTDCSGHVISVDLRRNGLRGTIPPEIGNVTNLKRLRFSLNQLSGPIPAELGRLTRLQFIDFRDNQLSGSIPEQLGLLTVSFTGLN